MLYGARGRLPHDDDLQVAAIHNKIDTFLQQEAEQLVSGSREAERLCSRISSVTVDWLRRIDEFQEHFNNRSAAEREAVVAVVTEKAAGISLSNEQHTIVEQMGSGLLQGRSGTGKSVVIVERIVAHQFRHREINRGHRLRQVFVTRSTMLRESIAQQLGEMGLDNNDCLCLTWNDFVQICKGLHANKRPMPEVDFSRFCKHYYPRLFPVRKKQQSLPPPPLLVWTEYFNQLRSFSHLIQDQFKKRHQLHTARSYQGTNEWTTYANSSEMSSLGVPLTMTEKEAIYESFSIYATLKHEFGEQDTVDLAMAMMRYAAKLGFDEMYVDEAQDFAPAELATLLFAVNGSSHASVFIAGLALTPTLFSHLIINLHRR